MRLILSFTDAGREDYEHWAATDRKMLNRVNRLITDTLRDPDHGIGQPELLKANLTGCSSRRITDEHRLVYRVIDEKYLVIAQARYHY